MGCSAHPGDGGRLWGSVKKALYVTTKIRNERGLRFPCVSITSKRQLICFMQVISLPIGALRSIQRNQKHPCDPRNDKTKPVNEEPREGQHPTQIGQEATHKTMEKSSDNLVFP